MKTKEITENNKLIAEFMAEDGVLYMPDDTYIYLQYHYAQRLKYNTSWDWLMPVVEKIDSLLADGEFIISGYRTCYLDIYTPSWIFPEYSADSFCITGEGESRLESMLNCVLEFITWYNENK